MWFVLVKSGQLLASDDCSSWVKVNVMGSFFSQGTATVIVMLIRVLLLIALVRWWLNLVLLVSIPLTQAAPLSVSQTELYSNSIENFVLSVIASGEWNVKSMIVGLKQKNSGEIVVTTLANDAKISRTGTVEVVAGAESNGNSYSRIG